MTQVGYVPSMRPVQITHGGKMPQPSPPGEFPPEDSRLWLFVPECIQRGEAFIQQDTIEWLHDLGTANLVICRSYPTHPRWIVVNGQNMRTTKARSDMSNGKVISEIHLLARRMRNMPDFPDWVRAVMSLKQQQSDVAYRISKAARKTAITHLDDAMKTFAERAPAAFVRFLAATFIPKKIEADIKTTNGFSGVDPESLSNMVEAFENELKRREAEGLRDARTHVLDYEPPVEISPEALAGEAEKFREAAAAKPGFVGPMSQANPREMTRRLRQVRDIMDPAAEEIENAEIIDDSFWE